MSKKNFGGDLLKILQNTENTWVVNPINTQGAMGAGLAKQFRDQVPGHYSKYRDAIRRGEISTGKMWLDAENRIIGFPTKAHWRDPSEIRYIKTGLQDLAKQISSGRVGNTVIPRIGSGLGGLHFENEVLPLIKSELAPVAGRVAISSGGEVKSLLSLLAKL